MMEKGQKVALLAIGVNLVLFGMKYLFAVLSGSIALKAEAFHSLSDVIASALYGSEREQLLAKTTWRYCKIYGSR